ncbi:unnamed protein product, partial [Penicillium salamii]
MLDALEVGRVKLDEYYSQTDSIRGYIHAISTMLVSVNKFRFFRTGDWDDYWRDDSSQLKNPKALNKLLSILESMLDGLNPNEDISDVLGIDEEYQSRFPAIAALACDTLLFPATGAGVERLFNTARDICHYRRGR